MKRRGLRILGVFGIAVALLLLAAYPFRVALLTYGANWLLAPYRISVHDLQGITFNTTTVTLQAVELRLHDVGLKLQAGNLRLGYDAPLSDDARPLLLQVGTATLIEDPAVRDTTARRPAGETRISELLTLLRKIPVGTARVDDMTLAHWPDRVAIEVESSGTSLTTRVSSGNATLSGSLALRNEAPLELNASIESGAGKAVTLQLSLEPRGSGYQLRGEGRINAGAVQDLLATRLPRLPPLPDGLPPLNWDLSAYGADAIATTPDLALQVGIQADTVISLPAHLLPDLGAIHIDLRERVVFDIRGMEHYLENGANNAAPVHIALQEHARLRGSFEPSRIGAYVLQSDIEIAGLQLDLGATTEAGLHVETRQLDIQGPQRWLPRFDITADIGVRDGTIHFDSTLLLPAAPTDYGMVARGDYQIATGLARISATLPPLQFLPEEERSLSAYLGDWPWTFDLLSGSLGGELELVWQASGAPGSADGSSISGQLSIELDNVAGYIGDYIFSGLNLPFTGRLNSSAPFLLDTPRLRLEAALLDVGFPLENLLLEFELDGDNALLHLPFVQVETLDGRVYGEALDYYFDHPRNELTLQFSSLHLERMLTLVEYDGVTATGAISGQLPVVITEEGIEVAGGTLSADAPGGNIRYLGAATGDGNAGLDLVNRALSNYRFESLESTIDYRPDGELLFAMQLKGMNPDMNNGQRINLNLTLSDNIPVLLESLQARRTIEDILEAVYRK